MHVTFLGRSEWTDARIDVATRLGWDVRVDGVGSERRGSNDRGIVVLALRSDEVLRSAHEAVRKLDHVFIDSVRLPPVRDLERLLAGAREAGVQLSYARPLWFHPLMKLLRSAGRSDVFTVNAGLPTAPSGNWRRALHRSADLCGDVCGTFATRSIEAAAARDSLRTPAVVLFTLRFLNGALAHVRLGPPDMDAGIFQVTSGSPSGVVGDTIQVTRDLIEKETDSFLTAVESGRPMSVEFRAGIDAARLVERILANLR